MRFGLPLALVLLLAEPAPPPAAAPPVSATGYWISAELYGPASARSVALSALATATPNRTGDPSKTPPAGLTGESVAHVANLSDAIALIAAEAFEPQDGPIEPPNLRLDTAARPGARIEQAYGVLLRSFAIAGTTGEGDRRPVDWPSDATKVLPDHVAWLAADLVPDRAPIFAAPAPSIPPASERFAMARREGQIFVVRVLDRCRDRPEGRQCLRWAAVVARTDDRFVPGYLPAAQVAVRDQWVHGTASLPRATLLRSGVDGPRVRYALYARARAGTLHRATVWGAMNGDAFPDANLTVEGDVATVLIGSGASQRFPLDATLDRRPRKAAEVEEAPTPPQGGDAADPPAADAAAAPRSATQ